MGGCGSALFTSMLGPHADESAALDPTTRQSHVVSDQCQKAGLTLCVIVLGAPSKLLPLSALFCAQFWHVWGHSWHHPAKQTASLHDSKQELICCAVAWRRCLTGVLTAGHKGTNLPCTFRCMQHGSRCNQNVVATGPEVFSTIEHAHTNTLVWRNVGELGGGARDALLRGWSLKLMLVFF